MWYCVLKDDLRFVYCGQNLKAAMAAYVPGTHLVEAKTYGEALKLAAVEVGQAYHQSRAPSRNGKKTE
jgi:hypothetical protein